MNEEARADRAKRIIDGARRTFIQNGFSRSTMDQICKAADVSVANIYQYFPNKESLIAELVKEDLVQALLLIESVGESDLSDAHLRSILAPFFTAQAGWNFAVIAAEISSEASRNAAIANMSEQSFAQAQAALAQAIERQRALGKISTPVPAERVSEMLCTLFDGTLQRFVRTGAAGDILLENLLVQFDLILNPPLPQG